MNGEKYTGWHKSRHSGNANSCVEIGYAADGGIGVRDSKQHGLGPVLEFSSREWQAFLAGVRDGEFSG